MGIILLIYSEHSWQCYTNASILYGLKCNNNADMKVIEELFSLDTILHTPSILNIKVIYTVLHVYTSFMSKGLR